MQRLDTGRLERVDLLQGLGVFTLEVREAELHLALRLNQVRPRLPQCDIRGLELQGLEKGHGGPGTEHRAMIGDEALRAPIGRQCRTEELEDRRELVMCGGHPGQNRAGVAFQPTDAVDSTPLELDEIAHIDQPEVMPIGGARGQVARLCRGLLLRVAGAGPGAGGPMHTPIDGHGPPDSGFTGQSRAMRLGSQPVHAQPPGARGRLLEVQDLLEKRPCQLCLEMRRGVGALILQPSKAVAGTGINDGLPVGPGHLEAARDALCVPAFGP
jgi:hypothetical protein